MPPSPLPPPSTPSSLPTNLARSLSSEPFRKQQEKLQLEADAQELKAARQQLLAEREAAALETAALREQRRELEAIKAELEKALPAHAAARIQARVRARWAQSEVARKQITAMHERQMARAAAQLRAETRQRRRDEKRRVSAVMRIQCAVRGFRARREVRSRHDEMREKDAQRKRDEDAVRETVRASLGHTSKDDAVTRLQAAARGLVARRGTQLPAVLRKRRARAKREQLEERLRQMHACTHVQAALRGLRGRRRAGLTKEVVEHQQRQRQQARTAQVRADVAMRLRRSAAIVALQNGWRSLLARRAAEGRRADVAKGQHARAQREERQLEQLRNHPLAQPSATPAAATSKEAALTAIAATPANAPAAPGSRRAQATRRAAALRLQTARRGLLARRAFAAAADHRRAADAEAEAKRAYAAAEREARRRRRREEKAVVRIQSRARAHWAQVAVNGQREASRLAGLIRAAKAAGVSANARSFEMRARGQGGEAVLRSTDDSSSFRPPPLTHKPEVLAGPLAAASHELRLTIHSAVFNALMDVNHVHQVWIVVELAAGRLLSATTPRVTLPKAGRPVGFSEAPVTLRLEGSTARELSQLLSSSDPSDSDLIFSLFGAPDAPDGGAAGGAQAALYLGEAYVNLQEMLRETADVLPSTPLPLVGSAPDDTDVEIGALSVSVTAVGALRAMLAASGLGVPGSREPSPRNARASSQAPWAAPMAAPVAAPVDKGLDERFTHGEL